MNDFEIIFKYAGSGMAVVAKDGTIIKANPSLGSFLQVNEQELVGKTFMEITHPDDLQKDLDEFNNLIAGNIETYTLEKRYKVNGHYVWGLLTVARVENKDYVISEVHDITNVKNIQEELQNFAYAASHDLREPLRIINGYAYMMQSSAQNLPLTTSYYINNMVDATNRMSEMIDGLLSYSRINQEKSCVKLNLNKIITAAKNNLAKRIEETQAHVEVKGKGSITGVKGQLIQVFQNLIDNAIKYKQEDESPKISITIQASASYIRVGISDNGIGIRAKDFKKIFQIFKQLHPKEKYEGRGVGLSIVRQIIDHHHGQIWLTSELGKGSTFYISFPTIGV